MGHMREQALANEDHGVCKKKKIASKIAQPRHTQTHASKAPSNVEEETTATFCFAQTVNLRERAEDSRVLNSSSLAQT